MAKKIGIPFEENNTAALKWKADEIFKTLDGIYKWLTEDTEGKKCQYIGEAIAKISITLDLDLYPDVWAYWKRVSQSPIGVETDKESQQSKAERTRVFRLIKRIESILQARMVSGAMKMKTSVPMSIFILKNQGWSDQQHLDVTTDGGKIDRDTTLNVNVINTNPNVKLDDKGNVIEDKT